VREKLGREKGKQELKNKSEANKIDDKKADLKRES
jgi:hypothetical protein